MATLSISDVLKPENWNQYGVQRTMELSALRQAGIVGNMQGVQLPTGGGTVNIPHWDDLTGESETLIDNTALTPAKFAAGKQVAVVRGVGKAWEISGLAQWFAGSDPAKALLDGLAGFWARDDQKELLSVLNGAFAAASMSGLVHDISAGVGAAAVVGADAFIDAGQKLGDAKSKLTAIAMHSATEAKLAKLDLITYEKDSQSSDRIPLYQGKRVIVDDGCPVAGAVYTTYLFGPGALGYDMSPAGESSIEKDRDILVDQNLFTMRRRFILHPRGMKWVGTPAGDFPTRAEMAVGTNWQRVYEPKAIPIVQFKHKLA